MEQIKIFLVDDEPMAIRHIKRVLGDNQEAYQIVGTAENGRQALKIAGNLPSRYDFG